MKSTDFSAYRSMKNVIARTYPAIEEERELNRNAFHELFDNNVQFEAAKYLASLSGMPEA